MLVQAEQMHKMTFIHSKCPKFSFWVEIDVILSVAQLVTTVIFFSAFHKSRVKWDNSRKPTQKQRTIKKNHTMSSKSTHFNDNFKNWKSINTQSVMLILECKVNCLNVCSIVVKKKCTVTRQYFYKRHLYFSALSRFLRAFSCPQKSN